MPDPDLIIATCADCKYDIASIAQSNNFQFLIENATLMSSNITVISIPDITMGSVLVPTRLKNIPRQGSSIEYGQVDVTFFIDQNYRTYFEVFDWFRKAKNPENLAAHEMEYSDGSLILLDNNQNPMRYVRFIDMFPIALGQVSFNTSSPTPLTCTASFLFDYFEEIAIGTPSEWDNS